MEEQEDLGQCSRWGHSHLGFFRAARIPLPDADLPLPHTLACNPLSMVKRNQPHQQVGAFLLSFQLALYGLHWH